MKNIEELKQGCAAVGIGSRLRVVGLVSSSGEVRDIEVTLLAPEAYREMQREDLETLRQSLGVLPTDGDARAAAEQMVEATQKALAPTEPGATSVRAGPRYEPIEGGPFHSLESDPSALYLLRLRQEGELPAGKAPKGNIPLQKYLLTRKLELQVSRYLHVVKLKDGGFASVEIC